MLRIDETSNTLVAPQAGGLVTEVNPDRADLLALLVSSWDAFSAELGHPSLRLLAAEPVPGLDILAFDEQAGRAVVVQVTAGVEFAEFGRAAAAAAQVASWDAAALAAVHESLSAVAPGDSPQVVLIAGGFDAATVATVDWLSRRHGVELSCFAVSFLRFGAERMLTVHREFPRATSTRRTPPPRSSSCWATRHSASRPPKSPAPRPPASPASRHSGTTGRASARPAGFVQRFSGTRTVALSVVEFPQLSVAR